MEKRITYIHHKMSHANTVFMEHFLFAALLKDSAADIQVYLQVNYVVTGSFWKKRFENN